MNIKKQLYQVLNCPICKQKKFITHGFVNGIHPDLIKLCKLLECKNCKHWFLSKMPKKIIIESLYKKNSEYVFDKESISNIKKKTFNTKTLKLEKLNTNHWIFKVMKNYKKETILK